MCCKPLVRKINVNTEDYFSIAQESTKESRLRLSILNLFMGETKKREREKERVGNIKACMQLRFNKTKQNKKMGLVHEDIESRETLGMGLVRSF